jgi:predicted lysophospholipase L1 biosynthesis ABC-type transport system permease subunit
MTERGLYQRIGVALPECRVWSVHRKAAEKEEPAIVFTRMRCENPVLARQLKRSIQFLDFDIVATAVCLAFTAHASHSLDHGALGDEQIIAVVKQLEAGRKRG